MSKERETAQIEAIREALGRFSPASKVNPNQKIAPDQVHTPASHRSVLDLNRVLVVGNRGMGKSLWTHALMDPIVRGRVAAAYANPVLANAHVVIGFNASTKPSPVAPTRDALVRALAANYKAEDIWQAVIYRAVRQLTGNSEGLQFEGTLAKIKDNRGLVEEALAEADDALSEAGDSLLVLFDALDRLADDWSSIRELTGGLMKFALGLKSFGSIKTKIFIRPDQYADPKIFQFPDGSKLKNEHVNLSWQPYELFSLLFFQLLQDEKARPALGSLAKRLGASTALEFDGPPSSKNDEKQALLINALAGQYMGTDARRGKVYTWVPTHLSDAKNACSPRTFLTAWQVAALHGSSRAGQAVDHQGILQGVRTASGARLEELREDYPWIDSALKALQGEFVPAPVDTVMEIWERSQVVQQLIIDSKQGKWLAPIDIETETEGPHSLLQAMINVAVMEERSNGKINVPDIFRVEAGIKRKGGVAVPRRP